MLETINRFVTVPSTDPDDERRAKNLNIFIVGLGFFDVLAILLVSILILVRVDDWQNLISTLWSALIFLAVLGVLFWVNHKGRVLFASSLFVVSLTVAITAANAEALGTGSTLFYFVIPVMIASALIRPYACFFSAAFNSLIFIFVALSLNLEPDYYIGIMGMFVIAFVSWFSARSLENALSDLRQINLELDQRVEQRTQELAQANAQLRQLDELKSRFVSDVSHELRTPISNLAIYLEMLEERGPEKRGRYLAVLREETDRLKTLVSDVLDLSRMEMATSGLELAKVDFNQVVEKIVTANQIQAHAKGLQLSFAPGADLPPISLDIDQISQVVNNLVGNAINYTPEGGSVNVSTKSIPALNQIVLEVEDTGIGISPKDIPHLFERFYRGQQTGQSPIPGTGLGLAITKDIIDMHDGHIDVKSEVGVGSTFTIYLPLREADV